MDEQVEIEVNLDTDTIATLALAAHERDITLNQFIVELLEEYMEQHNE